MHRLSSSRHVQLVTRGTCRSWDIASEARATLSQQNNCVVKERHTILLCYWKTKECHLWYFRFVKFTHHLAWEKLYADRILQEKVSLLTILNGVNWLSELRGHMIVQFGSGVRTRGNVKASLKDTEVRKWLLPQVTQFHSALKPNLTQT